MCLWSSEVGKSVYALWSWMSTLHYTIEPEVECSDNNANDVAFVQAAATIGGHNAVEEFMAYNMYMLASNFGFRGMTIGTTPMSKVQTPLPLFPVEAVHAENAGYVLAEIDVTEPPQK
jgi:hypothetical protein